MMASPGAGKPFDRRQHKGLRRIFDGNGCGLIHAQGDVEGSRVPCGNPVAVILTLTLTLSASCIGHFCAENHATGLQLLRFRRIKGQAAIRVFWQIALAVIDRHGPPRARLLVHVESIDAFFIQRLTCGIKGGVEIYGLLPPQGEQTEACDPRFRVGINGFSPDRPVAAPAVDFDNLAQTDPVRNQA